MIHQDVKETPAMIHMYTLAAIGLLAAASPGPDFVVVAKNALSYNRLIGITTALGIAAGLLFHVSYCVLGLAIIISHSILLFSMIKYLGAAYLIYIGIKNLKAKTPISEINISQNTSHTISLRRAFTEGFLTNLLNPKVTLFMLTVFTLLIKPETPYWQQVAYGVELATVAFLWFTFLSIALSSSAVKKKYTKVQAIVTKVFGATLCAIGIGIALEHK